MKTNSISKAACVIVALFLFTGITGNRVYSQGQERQGPPTAEERLKQVDEKVIKPLKLTQVKHDAVYKAYKEFYASLQKLRDEAEASGGGFDRSKMEPLRNQRDEKIKKVLTADEYKKWQELDQANRPQRGGPPPGQGQPPHQN